MREHSGLLMGVIVAVPLGFATTAMAADPTSAGSASIGTHPSYGSSYAAFWKTGTDYSVLSDGNKTYINAPNGANAIYFRGANNATNGAPDPDGWRSRAFIDGSSNLMVGNTVYGGASRFSGALPLTVPRGVYGYMNDVPDGVAVAGVGAGSAVGVQGSSFSGFGVIGNSTNGWGGMFGQDDDDVYNYGITVAGLTTAVLVDGKSYFYGDITVGTPPCCFPGTGSLSVAGNISYGGTLTHTSDQRVRVVSYKYNGLGGTVDNGVVYVGVVAQELEKVLPTMVTTEKTKLRETDAAPVDLKRVDTGTFTYLLINSVKELAKQNKDLLARQSAQDARLNALAEQNEKLAAQNRALATLIGRRLGTRSVALAR